MGALLRNPEREYSYFNFPRILCCP
ncbi:hypothetical protein Goklo_023273 [Gossypium klotzschianum]|uniref:Uncharacterized protein n=1 Tax=Gossypium klotzschianum TaxID=34286 RepID=A0A7J8TQF1_9ROSI|nr:hypothetical protein [Gossypium klotzschianum]